MSDGSHWYKESSGPQVRWQLKRLSGGKGVLPCVAGARDTQRLWVSVPGKLIGRLVGEGSAGAGRGIVDA